MLSLFVLTPNIKAQHDPMFTQYMFNALVLNPAYAGTDGVLTAMIMSRHQWVGFEDAPSTQTFSMHTPVISKNFGLGLSLISDRIGPIRNTTTWLDYSYQVYLSDKTRMSFGLKGGFSYFQKDLSRYANDIDISDDYVDSKFFPNFGFGIHIYGSKFYVGLATPRLVENKLNDYDEQSSTFISKENRLYLLMSGFVISLNEELALRPSVMFRATQSAPLGIDVNLNLVIRDKLWIGALFRPEETIGGMIKYKITQQISAGYAFDTSFNKTSSYFGNTHEVMLGFEFDFRKEHIQNPRYF